jgi:hypothetical protein
MFLGYEQDTVFMEVSGFGLMILVADGLKISVCVLMETSFVVSLVVGLPRCMYLFREGHIFSLIIIYRV